MSQKPRFSDLKFYIIGLQLKICKFIYIITYIYMYITLAMHHITHFILNKLAKDCAHIISIPSIQILPLFPSEFFQFFTVLRISFFRPTYMFSFFCYIHKNYILRMFLENFFCPNNLIFIYHIIHFNQDFLYLFLIFMSYQNYLFDKISLA